MKTPRIGLIGIGGFGSAHVEHLGLLHERGEIRLTAAADPVFPQFRKSVERLKSLGARIFESSRELLESGLVDAVTCATPIPVHASMELDLAERRMPFYMEKPPAVTIQDMDRVIEAVQKAGIPAAIGFQFLSMPSIKAIKQRIVEGRYGAVKEVIATGIWKRFEIYYNRTSWAGKLMENGAYVLDGTLFNPLSHILHLALYFAGTEIDKAANPVNVRAELYHIHRIQSEDTSCLEAELETGGRLFFYATLCAGKQLPPEIIVELEKGTIRWTGGTTVSFIENGEEKTESFPVPDDRVHLLAFGSFIEALRSGTPVDCPPELCRSFVQTGNGAFLSSGLPREISERYIRRVHENWSRTAELIGIRQIIRRAIRERALFSDLEIPWAVPGRWVDVSNMQEFNLYEDPQSEPPLPPPKGR